jgi:hypothetical protein
MIVCPLLSQQQERSNNHDDSISNDKFDIQGNSATELETTATTAAAAGASGRTPLLTSFTTTVSLSASQIEHQVRQQNS